MADLEDIFTIYPQVAPMTGAPMPARQHFRVPRKMADIRYQRGLARPAAEVYLERLRDMGVQGIAVAKDAEPSVKIAAQKTGVGLVQGK